MDASKQIGSIADVLIHVIILFSFLSIFFFMYISKLESDAFKNELGDMISKQVNSLLDKNPDIKTTPEMSMIIRRFMEKYNTETRGTLERNIMLKFLAVFTVLVLLGIVLTIVLTVSLECHEKINITSIVLQNVVVFIFIGIVEYMFFTNVAAKYIPVMPSLMSTTILNTLKSEMKAKN